MPSLLNLKEYVTNQLGADNASTSIPKRDKIINQARREFYSARKWSFLFKDTIVTITSQVGSLPSNYNKKFDPIDVYTYSGNTKYKYSKVEWSEVDAYGTADYVYAIHKTAGQIKINQSTVSSINLDYIYLPADHPIDDTEDSSTEAAPDITPIGLLAIAKWWLSSERGTGKYQLFREEYRLALNQAIQDDAATQPVKPLYPRRLDIKTGYRGRNW